MSVYWFLDFTGFVSETELTGGWAVSVSFIYPLLLFPFLPHPPGSSLGA